MNLSMSNHHLFHPSRGRWADGAPPNAPSCANQAFLEVPGINKVRPGDLWWFNDNGFWSKQESEKTCESNRNNKSFNRNSFPGRNLGVDFIGLWDVFKVLMQNTMVGSSFWSSYSLSSKWQWSDWIATHVSKTCQHRLNRLVKQGEWWISPWQSNMAISNPSFVDDFPSYKPPLVRGSSS